MTAIATQIAQRPIRRRPPAAGKGRKRGTPNKVTVEVREAFRVLLESNAENMQSWLERTAARSPAKALAIVAQLAEYVTPRLQRAEIRATRDDTTAAARLGQSEVTAVEAADAYRHLLDCDNASAREVIAAAANASRAREGAVIEGELAGEPQPATAPAPIAPTPAPVSTPGAIAANAASAEATAVMSSEDASVQALPPDVQAARDAWHAERARGER